MFSSLKVNLALLSTIIFWASAFVGIRVGLVDYSPGALALLRFIVGSVSIGLIYHHMGIEKKVAWVDRIKLLTLGIAGIGIYNICLNYGEVTVTAGMASFIIGLMPVITMIMSMIFLKERQGAIVWLGIAISLFGLLMMTIGQSSENSMLMGILVILISSFMGALHTLWSSRYLKRYHPVAVTSWVIWGGTLMLMVFLPDLLKQLTLAKPQSTLAVIYMGVFPAALAYLAWSYVLNHLPASKASMYLYALPLLSTFMGFVFLHEIPTFISLLGGGIALLGAVIANRYREKPQNTTSVEVLEH